MSCLLSPLLSSGSGSAVDASVCVCGQMQVVSMHEEWVCVHMHDRIVFVRQEGLTSHCTEAEVHRLVLAQIDMFRIIWSYCISVECGSIQNVQHTNVLFFTIYAVYNRYAVHDIPIFCVWDLRMIYIAWETVSHNPGHSTWPSISIFNIQYSWHVFTQHWMQKCEIFQKFILDPTMQCTWLYVPIAVWCMNQK